MTILSRCLFAPVLAAVLAGTASAQCMRVVPNARPLLDGPGAFGPLHNTLTLECLRYVGYSETSNVVRALVEDEKDKYWVRVDDFMGEYSGRVVDITPERITVIQIVPVESGSLGEAHRYLFRDHSGMAPN